MLPSLHPAACFRTGVVPRAGIPAAPPDSNPPQAPRPRCARRAVSSKNETRISEDGNTIGHVANDAVISSLTSSTGGQRKVRGPGSDAQSGGSHLDIFADDFPTSLETEGKERDGDRSDNEEEPEEGSPTELIFKLDRRGDGWGEEIIPNITIERRPISRNWRRNRSKGPHPWEEGSLEQFLVEMGVAKDQVEAVAAAAVAWRVTPGGRPLIDRRRRSRVQRNMWLVADHLSKTYNILPGPEGLGRLLTQAPQILLCKPTQHDRWCRRVVELAGFMHLVGHCNVPESWPHNFKLSNWVKRQRTAKVEGELSQERLQILHALGFEFGEVAVITQEWENWFDALVEWLMQHSENQKTFSWSSSEWFQKGGWKAGELAVWTELQRELRRRNLLPKEAIQRLDAVNFCWEPETSAGNIEWISHFRELVYVAERQRIKCRKRNAYSPGDIMIPRETTKERTYLDAFTDHRPKASEGERRKEVSKEGASTGQVKWPMMDRLAGLKLDWRIQRWLIKQRLLWREGQLPPARITSFWTAKIDLNDYSQHAWIQVAAETANFVNGFHAELDKVNRDGLQSQEKGPQLSPRLYVKPEDVMSVTEEGDVIEWPSDMKVFGLSERTSALVNVVNRVNGVKGANGANSVHLVDSLAESSSAESGVNGHATKDTLILRKALPAAGKKLPFANDTRRRLKGRRWILTQRALLRESRLPEEQMKHMVFLGLGWLLSEKETNPSNAEWSEKYQEVADIVRDCGSIPDRLPTEVTEWLDHQRGLRKLGMLSEDRMQMLNELGMDWEISKSEDECQWDSHLMDLLEFKRVNSHLKVPRSAALGTWLDGQLIKWKDGVLPRTKVNQLRALGIKCVKSR